jgi:hypothetical protein
MNVTVYELELMKLYYDTKIMFPNLDDLELLNLMPIVKIYNNLNLIDDLLDGYNDEN